MERPARDHQLTIPVSARVRALAVGLVCGALITGCAASDGDPGTVSDSTPTAAPVTTPAETGPSGVAGPGAGVSSGGPAAGYPAASGTTSRGARRTPTASGKVAAPGAGAASVSIFGPLDDAPGASILTILTARGVGADSTVRFDVRLGGRGGECVGDQWTHAGGRSQACWVTVPTTPGRNLISASAEVTAAGGAARRTTTTTRPVTGKGPVTASVTDAERDKILRCGNTTDRVWLTFDDGFLTRTTMSNMLATLERENVKARFFATGQWARSHPSWVAQIRASGHLIGNHSSTHEWLNTLSESRLRDQIARGPRADRPRLLRPGFGGGAFSATVSRVAGSLGYGVCYWTVDPRDWDGVSADRLVATVMNGNEMTPPLRPGGIVLMHMTGKHTAAALPGLIAAIRGRGMEVEPLR